MSDLGPNQLLNGCPECQGLIDVSEVRPFEKILCPHCNVAIRVRTAFNHFTILTEIGEGGMSRVFLAQDNTLGREVALKILHSHYGERPDLLAQFEQEARVTASINHPNVVQVYSVGRDQGYFYIAMELLDGDSLDKVLAQQAQVDEISALKMIHEVALGLAAAHQKGLIHRDIKPGNILVDHAGTAKLVDFGLAIMQGAEEDPDAEIWATPFYVPPEKLRRQREDFRSDIYSLGATLYHALAGQPPCNVHTNSVDELLALKSRPVDIRSVAPHLREPTVELVHRMMARIPDQRFSTYDQLLDKIAEVRDAVDPNFTAGAGATGIPLWIKLVGGGIGIALIAGVSLYLIDLNKTEQVEFGEDSGVSFGETEVVVSTTDLSFQKEFEKAWKTMAAGNLGDAYGIFRAIADQEKAKSEVKIWSVFHLGLIGLFEGRPEETEKEFNRLEELEPEMSPAQQSFFTHLLKHFRMDSSVTMDTAEASPWPELAELVFGLKNWDRGSHLLAEDMFADYAEAEESTVKEKWALAYEELLADYRKDAPLLARAPSPALVQGDTDLLEAAVKQLEEMEAEALTPQGKAFLAERKEKFYEEMSGILTQRKEEMMARETEILSSVRMALFQYANDRSFAQGTQLLSSATVTSEESQRKLEHYRDIWTKTAAFFTQFTQSESVKTYEGPIYQADPDKDPFTAKIAAMNADFVWVDLGFGPTKMDLSNLSVLGLLRIAQATFLLDADSTAQEGAAYFAYFTGLESEAEEMAEDLREIAGFSARWDVLTSEPES